MANLVSIVWMVFLLANANVGGEERYLEWRADQPLTWSDFKGPVDGETEMLAMTKSKLKYSWQCDDNGFSFTVLARFDRGKSWKKSGEVSDRILAHEQLHFDITDLYARKMRQFAEKLENPCKLTVEEMKEKLMVLQIEWDDRQKQYDRETDHSLKRDVQEKWADMVAYELKVLQKYASA